METPKEVKSQAIADLLAQFPREEEFPLDDEVPGEVVMAEEVREQWVMKFDGSSITQSGGMGVVLYHEEDKAVALSFKLEFPCSNNMAEYEAYLIGLATTLEMGVKHLKGNGPKDGGEIFNFRNRTCSKERKPVCGCISRIRLANNVRRGRDNTRVVVNKREESIIEVLKERFREEMCKRDWRIPIREALMKEEGAAELKVLKDYALVRGELYCKMLGGVLSRCIGQEEA
ncbi:uncharacterized protein LOC126698893 [Quercus robur]|uniref:uncharacterized protein LOC126698893 n=1 Tax=Quercus robur TaxID=38942 RepID=UPI0021618C15|nr:uncharacterized protein LOC126698893 [Quercus robur]